MNLGSRTAVLLLGMAVLILGTLPLILKLLVREVDPLTLTAFRFSGSAAILAAIGNRRLLTELKRNATKRGLILAATAAAGLTGNYVFFMMGLQYLSPSTTHIVLQTAPFLVLAGGILIYREPLTRRLGYGILLLAIGSALFFNQRIPEIRWGTDFVIGVGIAFVSACGWAVFFLTQKALHDRMTSGTILFCCCGSGAVLLSPFAHFDAIASLDTRLMIFLLASTVATVVGYTSISTATRRISATTMGMALSLVPLVTVFAMILLADLIDGLVQEGLNLAAITGALLVVAGLIIGTTTSNKGTR